MKNILKKIVVYILTLESKLILKKYRPKIVAITGSVGKTGTKDVVHALFSKLYFAEKSPKSFNSEFGAPLAIIGCEQSGWNNPLSWLKIILGGLTLIILPNHYPKWLILEIGADRPGDIESIARWIPVDVAIFTRMGEVPVHVEFFDSPAAILKEKLFLLDALKPEGVVVFNYDDQIIKKEFENKRGFNKISYGFEKGADISASNYKIVYKKTTEKIPSGVNFKINFKGTSVPATIYGTIGKQQIYSTLAGVAAVLSQGGNPVVALGVLKDYNSQPGRMKILKGLKDTVIIDDSYNSSPIALLEALQTIESVTISGRKFVVLGDMMEIGKYSIEEHRKIGIRSAEVADFIFVVGVRAKYIAEGALEAGFSEEKIFNFDDARLAGKGLELKLAKGDLVLVKGSQSMRMERVVEEVVAEPLRKNELLVRQEEEWLAR